MVCLGDIRVSHCVPFTSPQGADQHQEAALGQLGFKTEENENVIRIYGFEGAYGHLIYRGGARR